MKGISPLDCLTDAYLISNCMRLSQQNYPQFISPASQASLSSFLNGCVEGNIPDDKIDTFHDLWKKLLSDAITFLKSVDKREHESETDMVPRDVVAFGVQELYKYFEEYRSFEALLYGADNFYRDHVMHVFRVWLMGMWLIEQFESTIFWDFEDMSELISEDELAAMWCIVALTHDLGYPLDKVEKVQAKIASMMRYFGGSGTLERGYEIPVQHHFINDFILTFIGSKLIRKETIGDANGRCFGTAKQSKYYLKFSKSLENFDHGIISCILLMKNLVYFLESDLDLGSPFGAEDARQFYIRREILRAIACHTCTDIYHLQPNSLSFILILADELQVWGRPTFHEIKSGKYRLTLEAQVPEISSQNIGIKLNVSEVRMQGSEKDAGRHYIEVMCRKWHKWLRSALGSYNRKFEFYLEALVKPVEGETVTYRFVSKPGNHVSVYIDGTEQGMDELLYP